MSDIVLRKMKPADLDAVMAILEYWSMAPQPPSTEVPDPERRAIAVNHSFVALNGERIVGVCSYIVRSAKEAETASLAVHPEYRGSGVGYRLQTARLEEIRRRGFLRVRTEADRPEVIAWYKRKFGYVEKGTVPKRHAFGLPDVDHWTVLELDLTHE